MKIIEYKDLAGNFVKGVSNLASDIEDVEDGELSDKDQRAIVISDATSKLAEYDNLLQTLQTDYVQDFKDRTGRDMEYIRELLISISKQ